MAEEDYGVSILDGIAGSDEQNEESNQGNDDGVQGLLQDYNVEDNGPIVQFNLPREEETPTNDFTISDIRDGIAGFRTNQHYVRDCFHFIEYCYRKAMARMEPFIIFFTPHGLSTISDAINPNEGERTKSFKKRQFMVMQDLLRFAWRNPFVDLSVLTPEYFITYLTTLRSKRNGNYLSNSSYNTHRAALFHLFRKHNGQGYPDDFGKGLKVLHKGFKRLITNRRTDLTIGNNNNGDDETVVTTGTNRYVGSDDAKDPLSVELLREILRWFLEFNTSDGVFAYTYALLTWNLMCRSENTALIQLCDISWSQSFDAFSIVFAHSKTDQLGEHARYPRHIYANTTDTLV